MDDIDGDAHCDIHHDGNAGRLHVNAVAPLDARQPPSCISHSPGAIGNVAFLAIDGRTHRRTDLPGARQGRRCQPGR